LAFEYLAYPYEIAGFLLGSYAVLYSLLGLALLTLLVQWPFIKPLRTAIRTRLRRKQRAKVLLGTLVWLLVLLPLLFKGPFGTRDSRYMDDLASNGFFNVLHIMTIQEDRFAPFYPSMEAGDALALSKQQVNSSNTQFSAGPDSPVPFSHYVDNGEKPRNLNVVLVIEESFGSLYTESAYAQRHISPNLQKLRKEGLYFNNLFATGTRTARGLEAILTSLPPLAGGATIKREQSEGMGSLATVLNEAGYHSSFFYAGHSRFDSIGPFTASIGFDEVLDIRQIEDQSFTTVWGVADEYLFGQALKYMDQQSDSEEQEPQFLTLLTVSNHIPYDIPEGRIDPERPAASNERSAAYADWAFYQFIEQAREKPWFDNTVFVFVADHAPRIDSDGFIPATNYRIPLLFYSPANIQPKELATLGSSIDLGPTLLGLLGISYQSSFFGADLNRVDPNAGRALMEHNFAMALMEPQDEENKMTVLMHKEPPRAYRLTEGDAQVAVSVDKPSLDKTIAIFQTAHQLFYSQQYK